MGILKYCAECLSLQRGFLLLSMMSVLPLPAQRWFDTIIGSLKSPESRADVVRDLTRDPHALLEAQLATVTSREFWNEASTLHMA